MPRAEPRYSDEERVARAIFAAEHKQLTGHKPLKTWVNTGWQNCKSMAQAAIQAMQVEKAK